MTIEDFIQRWENATGTEKANYQLFLTELCELLDLQRPDPASGDTEENSYVFERRVTFRHGDGSESRGFIDLYRRGCFVCEAKQTSKVLETPGWDEAMLRARGQAEQYARALPADEGRPPLLIVTDVGRSIELYAEFSRSGATYTPFPDPRSHRIRLEDLRREDIRERLRLAWLDPNALDPTRHSARVTRDIADRLARLAKSLESASYQPQKVAAFLMRCLFTMFAEDVGLLPNRSFTTLLQELKKCPEEFVPMVQALWADMNKGSDFSLVLRQAVLRFNGGLFADPEVLPLQGEQIERLLEAALADWRYVEPAIFGTLLERALDPEERHKLGAHYTPRAYVERLVLPSVIEPLREQWQAVQAAALSLSRQGKAEKAADEVRAFLHELCHLRILDPACGSGNFLYVTLEHLKRFEGEVLETLENLGDTQVRLEMAGASVDPHQFLGLEVNPRATTIAEMVLWIGYLQWHFRTRGNINPPEPVLRDFHNIECRDAVLDWDSVEIVTGESGQPVTRWDGKTFKQHPVTGKQVPDEAAQVPMEHYINPRKARWPQADYVVGNPPFIGTAKMRQALGDGYAEALRKTYPRVPESADYVMYWWHHAADLTRAGKLKRFGFITTNSIRQTFNRSVIQHQMAQKDPLSLVFAIPDHPWVDSADGAAVRIAMTVATAGEYSGLLQTVLAENGSGGEGRDVLLQNRLGKLFANLQIGANMASAIPLFANNGLSNRGMQLIGSGFIVTPDEAAQLGLGRIPSLDAHIRHYRNGRDLTQTPRGVMVIDLFGLTAETVRSRYPEVYQWVVERVKPERDHNNRASYRDKWWIFGEPRKDLRPALAGLPHYIATVETSKHRFFTLLDADILPDNMLVNIAVDSALHLGILSSRVHITWTLAAGGRLGVGNDPRYNKTRCFETFPFPDVAEDQKQTIRKLAEQIDAHRKRQQSLYPDLTLTGIYNVLEKLRREDPLNAKEKTIHEQGLVSVLRQLHDELDAAVFQTYGWDDLIPLLVGKPGATTPWPEKPEAQAGAEEELLKRLVALNRERHAQEQRGLIRWLRPEYQNPGGQSAEQAEAAVDTATVAEPAPAKNQPWPKALPEQVQALRSRLETADIALTAEQLARMFTRAQTKRVAELLETLVALGQVRTTDGETYRAS